MKMWIARNKDGTLALFKTKPICINDGNNILYWAGRLLYLSPYDFPEATFENSPMEVELVIKK